MNRRKLSLSDKLIILARQALCPVCGEPIGNLDNVDWDHEQALARGGPDTNDNIRAICRHSCHKVKTKTDVKEIAKTKRLDKKNAEFMRLISSRECGSKRTPKGKIKSRGFQKRTKGKKL